MKKKLLWLLLISFLVRAMLAATLELGNDEAYYTLYAERLDWNYFDHPPMIAWLLRCTTLFSSREFFVRLSPLLCATGGCVLIFSITRQLYGVRAAWIAGCLFTCSFYTSILSGTFLLPDGPEMFFWLVSISLMLHLLKKRRGHSDSWLDWMGLGMATGLAILSKVTGIFLWIGFAGYLLRTDRTQWRNPYLYVSLVIAAMLSSPIVLWNQHYHWVTYLYHSGRVNGFARSIHLDGFVQNVLGSLFYHNPVNMVAIGCMGWTVWRNRSVLPRHHPLLWWLAIPMTVIVLMNAFFNDTLPHWSGPAVTTLLIPAAGWLAEKPSAQVNRWLRWSGSIALIVIAGGLGYFFCLPKALGSPDPNRLGKGDIALDMTGWKEFAREFADLYRTDQAQLRMKPGAVILSDYWFPAGHLNYYIATPEQIPLMVTGPLHNVHQFAWKNARTTLPAAGSDAYFIYPSNYYGPPSEGLRRCFSGPVDSVYIPQKRAGITVRNFVVFRMKGLLADSLAAQLIRMEN